MAAIEINWKPDRRELRSFGLIALVAFGVLGGFVWWRGGLFGFDFGAAKTAVIGVMWALGLASGLLSLVAPAANKPLYIALVVATYPIGFVLSYAILGLLFYAVITPLGIAIRLFGIDPLSRNWDPATQSYWDDHEPAKAEERYFRQF
jgi:hypothetical protein